MSALTRPRHALLSLIQTNNSKSSWLRHLHSALGPARDLLAAMEALEHQLPPGINTISKPATWSPCRKALIRAYQERALILQLGRTGRSTRGSSSTFPGSPATPYSGSNVQPTI
jgi:hypothetical protein